MPVVTGKRGSNPAAALSPRESRVIDENRFSWRMAVVIRMSVDHRHAQVGRGRAN